jgi:transposase-like protein
LCFRFPLSLRMVEEMLAARGIIINHEAVRQRRVQVRPGLRQPGLPPAALRWRQVAPR